MIEGRSIELEKTVLVGIINSNQNEEKSKEYLAELKFLTYTAGGEVIKSFTQKLDFPNPKTFIGSDIEFYPSGSAFSVPSIIAF